ncbi:MULTISPECIES: 5'/3'-nucleotidase SurE [unclassified Psychrobacter]|uniref:5'/3'-nucleotidase SurE n=1 Tax=unclassified Psychrobacter TaxID=196806 RepID=UPI003FCFB259
MRFLISNDDGVYAPGLAALYRALSGIGEVVVVAPNTEQSGTASALTITRPLHTHILPSGFIAVNGSPADCIHLALHNLYQGVAFDCVVTGINSGANLGQDVLYSGTFGAALTAQLFGIPAIATSLVGGAHKISDQDQSYDRAANEIVKLLTQTSIIDTCKSLPYHVLNVNIPNVKSADDIQGRKITRLGHSQIAQPVYHMVDPRGRDAYWLSLRKDNAQNQDQASADTDIQAVAAGYISLSPVRLHHTPKAALKQLQALDI